MKFESARIAQVKTAKTRGNTRTAQDAHFATDGDPLPFVRLAPDTDSSEAGTKGGTGGGVIIRHDAASFPRPHLTRLRVRKADR